MSWRHDEQHPRGNDRKKDEQRSVRDPREERLDRESRQASDRTNSERLTRERENERAKQMIHERGKQR